MSAVTHLLAAIGGCAAGVLAMAVLSINRTKHDDFQTTSDWEPDPLDVDTEYVHVLGVN